MTMSTLYPYRKPYLKGTHNETAKRLTLFPAIIYGIKIKSWLRIPNLVGMLSALQTNGKFHHSFRNHSNSQFSQSDRCSRKLRVWAQIGSGFSEHYYESLLTEARRHHQVKGAQGNEGLKIISLLLPDCP